MNYSSTSKKLLVEVTDLSITYPNHFYKGTTLRDSFVNFFKDPLDSIFNPPEYINVIKNLNLKVYRGDRLGVLGINGSGKTSLCRHISGMHGDIQNIKVNGSIHSIFGTEMGIYPELSGKENIELLSILFFPTLNKIERKSLIEEVVNFTELGEFIYAPFRTYSKGMKARLFLSLVTALPSDLLILDEVFDGADIFFSKKISNRMLNMIKGSGAVIFVSHSLEQIKKVCNRAIIISDHQLFFDGDVDKALDLFSKNL